VAIFPAVLSFGLDPGEGPELAFITLPALFSRMPFGQLIGAVFFGLLITAALTSMVSVLEVPVAYLGRVTGWTRRRAAWVSTFVVFLAGLPSALSFGTLGNLKLAGLSVLDAIDYVASNLLLPVGALLVSLFVGWKWQAALAPARSDLIAVWAGLARPGSFLRPTRHPADPPPRAGNPLASHRLGPTSRNNRKRRSPQDFDRQGAAVIPRHQVCHDSRVLQPRHPPNEEQADVVVPPVTVKEIARQ
jgi:hypothetical protein